MQLTGLDLPNQEIPQGRIAIEYSGFWEAHVRHSCPKGVLLEPRKTATVWYQLCFPNKDSHKLEPY